MPYALPTTTAEQSIQETDMADDKIKTRPGDAMRVDTSGACELSDRSKKFNVSTEKKK